MFIRNHSQKNSKPWPSDAPWPEPVEAGFGCFWEVEDAESLPLDEDSEDLLEIKEYMDELVSEDRLNEDFSLNEDYDAWDDEKPAEEDEWLPEKGSDYWDNGFDIEAWEEDLVNHLNLLKLPLPSPVEEIQQCIGYEFINENLLRQAFTRRAFAVEYGVSDNENLEFVGDSILSMYVTREIVRQMTEIDPARPDGPFFSSYKEGDLSRIREHYVCREHLAERAKELDLDRFILYGSSEQPGESAKEDAIEALVGAVAVDSRWNPNVLETVIDRLLLIQLSNPNDILHSTYYDTLNAWHQKHFGRMPEYSVTRDTQVISTPNAYSYHCTLRYNIPENDKEIWTAQITTAQGETRSKAREMAAELAYRFIVNHGLWMNLSDAGIEPDLENSINQLQELYQKKYTENAPRYSFEERDQNEWYCTCVCDGIDGWGQAASKTKAKKKAAFMVLVRMMKAAGICKDEWKDALWKTIEN